MEKINVNAPETASAETVLATQNLKQGPGDRLSAAPRKT